MSRFLSVASFELPFLLRYEWMGQLWHVGNHRDEAHKVLRSTIRSILLAGSWALPVFDEMADLSTAP